MQEIENDILSSLKLYGRGPDGESTVIGQHTNIYTRFNFLDCKATHLLEAWDQIKRVVDLCAAGILDPKEHRAESYLLMLLQEAYHHGYTPKVQK